MCSRAPRGHQAAPRLRLPLAALLLAVAACLAPCVRVVTPPGTINGLVCPGDLVSGKDIKRVSPGTDNLGPVFEAGSTGVTYILAPGTYLLDQQSIQIPSGTTVCYIARAGAVVTVTSAYASGPMLNANGTLGLQGLTVDGGMRSGTVSVTAGDLYAQQVTIRNCNSYGLLVSAAAAKLLNVAFVGNSAAPNIVGGGILQAGGSIELNQVSFVNNTGQGGGMYLSNASSVVLAGPVTFTGNASPRAPGGALYVATGTLGLNQPLCAQGNSAAGPGGFAAIASGAGITFDASNGPQRIANNGATAIQASGAVSCAGTPGTWQAPKSYGPITGDVCGCAAQFVNGSATSCDSCAPFAWDAAACACKRPAASIKLTPSDIQLPGGGAATLAALVLDASGTPVVAGVAIRFSVAGFVAAEGAAAVASATAATQQGLEVAAAPSSSSAAAAAAAGVAAAAQDAAASAFYASSTYGAAHDGYDGYGLPEKAVLLARITATTDASGRAFVRVTPPYGSIGRHLVVVAVALPTAGANGTTSPAVVSNLARITVLPSKDHGGYDGRDGYGGGGYGGGGYGARDGNGGRDGYGSRDGYDGRDGGRKHEPRRRRGYGGEEEGQQAEWRRAWGLGHAGGADGGGEEDEEGAADRALSYGGEVVQLEALGQAGTEERSR